MPISFPFFLFAGPAQSVLRWVRIERAPCLPDLGPGEADRVRLEQELARRLPPRLARDILRDE
jgi:hypothetical protein